MTYDEVDNTHGQVAATSHGVAEASDTPADKGKPAGQSRYGYSFRQAATNKPSYSPGDNARPCQRIQQFKRFITKAR